MVCLDTGILIDYLKGDSGIVELVKSFAEKETISTTTITEYELLRHQDKIKRDLANEFLSSIKIYYFDREAAQESSRIYYNLRSKGTLINENDILIAGISFANKELLITRDNDFNAVGEMDKIRVI